MEYKYIRFKSPVGFYRVSTDRRYDVWANPTQHWTHGAFYTWEEKIDGWLNTPIEMTPLEVLLILGPKAISD